MDPPHPRRVAYIVSEDLIKVSSRLPSNPKRSYLVHALVHALGLLRPSAHQAHAHILRPPPARAEEIAAYHDAEFVAFLLDPAHSGVGAPRTEAHARFGLEDDCPPFPGLPAYARLVAGGALAAARAIRGGEADVAIFWDGGRHHASKSRAAGFCYVADGVLALLLLARRPPPSVIAPAPGGAIRPRAPRVLYLDLDVHFSDGVSRAFYAPGRPGPSNVLTLSLHHAAPGFFPADALAGPPCPNTDSFDPYTLSVPLARGAGDGTIARVWEACVERVVRAYAPEVVVLQCGADGLAGDPCAVWNWSGGKGIGGMGWCVGRVLGWGVRTVMLGGGGYNGPNAARAWAYLTALALGRPPEPDTPVPDHAAFPLYAPSFVLDVPAGHMRDENTAADLQRLEDVYTEVAQILAERHSASVAPAPLTESATAAITIAPPSPVDTN